MESSFFIISIIAAAVFRTESYTRGGYVGQQLLIFIIHSLIRKYLWAN